MKNPDSKAPMKNLATCKCVKLVTEAAAKVVILQSKFPPKKKDNVEVLWGINTYK